MSNKLIRCLLGKVTAVLKQTFIILGHSIDLDILEKDIAELKEKNKMLSYSYKNSDIPKKTIKVVVNNCNLTNDSFKLKYSSDDKGQYYFKTLHAKVEVILVEGDIVDDFANLRSGSDVLLILDRTNLWSTLKGDSDQGIINLMYNGSKVGEVAVRKVLSVQGYVYHFGTLISTSV